MQSYQQTDAFKSRFRNPLKVKARKAVWNLLRYGKLQKQPCEQCTAPKVEAHHDDYEKPLDVRWVCRSHHTAIHASA
jgi:ribosomal protein S27AE